MELHVTNLLTRAALEEPERPFLLGDGRLTYGALYAAAQRLAAELRRMLPDASGIGLALGRGDHTIISFFAAAYAGLTALPFTRSEPASVIEERLARVGCRGVLVDRESSYTPLSASITSVHVCADQLLSSSAIAVVEPPTGSADIALWLFTSGTTSRSKVACIDHRGLFLHSTRLAAGPLGFDRNTVVLGTLPLCHSFGLRLTVLATMAARGTLVLVDRFDAVRCLTLASTYGASFIAGVPTMFAAWARVAKSEDTHLDKLGWCLSAGAPLSEAIRIPAEARLGAEIRQGYGLTEATFSAMNATGPRAPGTCGTPSPGVEIRLSDRSEIEVRGDNLMRGYLGEPPLESDVWFSTGDLGKFDAQGRLLVVDRLKDIVIRGGHNIVPAEIEAIVRQARGVVAVAAVGRTDERLGEELVVVLVVDEDFDLGALKAHLDASLPKTRRPRYFATTDTLPLGPSRKVLRRELRRLIEAGEIRTTPL